MSFDLVHIWQSMDLFARAVVLALLVMATCSLAVFAERLWAFSRARRSSESFGELARAALATGEYERLVGEAKGYAASPLAGLLSAGVKTYLVAARRPRGKVEPVELARRELERKAEAIGAELRRGFGVLASVGSVAPFVGLLGTVVGIIAAFQNIAREGSSGVGAVSAGIAEALVVTALGLVVAIPAVLAFNLLSGKADAIALALDQSRGELVDHLEAHERPTPTASGKVALSDVAEPAWSARPAGEEALT